MTIGTLIAHCAKCKRLKASVSNSGHGCASPHDVLCGTRDDCVACALSCSDAAFSIERAALAAAIAERDTEIRLLRVRNEYLASRLGIKPDLDEATR